MKEQWTDMGALGRLRRCARVQDMEQIMDFMKESSSQWTKAQSVSIQQAETLEVAYRKALGH